MGERSAVIIRNTKETKIQVSIDLDGTGCAKTDTGIGFLDHMLEAFARHGLFDLEVKVDGDLQVDCHHTVEDLGIVLGMAVKEALGEKEGICRYGFFLLPMDEVLARCAVDLSGRPYLKFQADFTCERLGTLSTEMFREFFYALSYACGMNLHLSILEGGNNHHMAEALFKAFAKALDMATKKELRIEGVWSTKGSL